MNIVPVTPEMEAAYLEWVATRPTNVQEVARRFRPWTLYRMSDTGHRVHILGFDEMESGEVAIKVMVSGRFNFVVMEREVFGIAPATLSECDLPGPDETVGSMDVPIEIVRKAFRSQGET